MKVFALVLAICATSAVAEIDWSNVRPVVDMPGFWDNKPAVYRLVRAPKTRARIVNGHIAEPHQFPYQAGLLFEFPQGTSLCGGALINSHFTLTAAHCVDVASGGLVIYGAHFLRQIEPNQQRINVQLSGINVHPLWNPSLIQNDIAILRHTTPVTLNAFVSAVVLPNANDGQFENEPATVSGWGRFSDDLPQASDVLRFYRGTILPQTNCRIRFPGIIQDSNICLSGLNNGGACQGDSGGPLTYTRGGQSVHIGVVSFGLALGCEALWPSVFARTTFYLTWIQQNSIH